MAKIIQGVDNVNRELKQLFGGVEGVNREFKERWEGVGGVNRKVFFTEPQYPVLYDSGRENISVVGGFGAYYGDNAQSYVVRTLTKNSDRMTLYASNTNVYGSTLGAITNNALNLSAYSYINITCVLTGTAYSYQIYICNSMTEAPPHTRRYTVFDASTTLSNSVYNLKVPITSYMKGTFRICPAISVASGGTITMDITKIWLS